jgi:hypothetical protein
MKVTLNGSKLIIEVDVEKDPAPSKSGKTKIIAGTGGCAKTSAEYKGKPVSVSLNATIPMNQVRPI